MRQIVFPLKLRMNGPEVADLHAALRRLLDRGVLVRDDGAARRPPSAGLERERAKKTFGAATRRLVAAFQRRYRLRATGAVDRSTAERLNATLRELGAFAARGLETLPELQHLVRGQVLYRGGLPIADLKVVAYHRELRGEIELGQHTTDADGTFEIYYRPGKIRKRSVGDRPPARGLADIDLLVRVYDASDQPLAESRVIFSAQRIEKVRLFVEGGPEKAWSEYEQLMGELRPLLGGMPIHELNERDGRLDVSLLAGKTGQPVERVAALVVAHKLAARTGLSPEVCYGFVRQGLPTNLAGLFAESPASRQHALSTALARRLIPGRLFGELADIEPHLRAAMTRYVAADGDGRALLGTLLAGVLPRARDREAFLSRYVAHKGPITEFWVGLREHPRLRNKVADLQLTVQLSALSGGHASLVTALRRRYAAGEFKTFPDLARLDAGGWEQIIRGDDLPAGQRVPATVPGETQDQRITLYASTLARILQDALPTAVLAHQAATDQTQSADVRRFWTNVIESNVEFELGGVRVRSFLDAHPQLLQGATDRAGVTVRLEATQRIFNLTACYAETKALLDAGLSSATDIARVGRDTFLRRHAQIFGNVHRAQLVYDKAAHIAATTMSLMAAYGPPFNAISLAVLPSPQAALAQLNGGDESSSNGAVATPADLTTLFGSLDLCQCEHCRSASGPAAYFAEVCAFLAERTQAAPTQNALGALLARRPDLGDLELTCANTNTVLPYIDLVNEVLENAVAPFALFTLPAAHVAELDARTVSAALRAAFAGHASPLSDAHFVVVVETGKRWFLTDHSVLYALRTLGGGQVQVDSATYQTGAPAAWLAAAPEHVKTGAYEILRDAVFPWTLPLDQWREETVVYLSHLGAQRHELMSEFTPSTPWATISSIELSTERLGISPAERLIITAQTEHDPWEFFGLAETGNQVEVFDPASPTAPVTKALDWLPALSWVAEVLKRASLEYEKLIELLSTPYVNPGRTVRITSADPNDPTTCEIWKLTLTNVDAAFADRLHRFTRLQRRLGWTAAELDQAITVLQGGVADPADRISDALLRQLSHVQRLRGRLSAPIEDILVFWGRIPIEGDESLYSGLFQNRAVASPVDPDFALVGGELAVTVTDPPNAKISTHTAPILAALRISAAELTTLAAAVVPSDELKLASLSALYRRVVLARGLGMPVTDLLMLLELIGLDVFGGGTAAAVHLAEIADRIGAAGLSVAELDYLLTHRSAERIDWDPSEAAIASMLDAIRAGVRKVREDTTPRPDPTGDITRATLASLRWPAELFDGVIGTLAGTLNTAAPKQFVTEKMKAFEWPTFCAPLAALPTGIAFPDTVRRRIYYDAPAQQLCFRGVVTGSDKTVLDSLSADAAYQAVVQQLFGAPAGYVPDPGNSFCTAAEADHLFDDLATPAQRYEFVLSRLFGYLRRVNSDRVVIGLLADALGISAQLTQRLIAEVVHALSAPASGAIADFLAEAFVASDPAVALTAAAFGDQFASYTRLVKTVRLITSLRFTHAQLGWLTLTDVPQRDVPWLTGAPVAVGWLRPDELPTEPSSPSAARFGAWYRLTELARLRDRTPGRADTLTEIFMLARDPAIPPGDLPATVLDALAARTGWDRADLGEIAGPSVLNLAFPVDVRDETGLARTQVCIRRTRRLGASAAQCRAFAVPQLTVADARAALQLVKAKYGEAEWPKVARPLRDQLRERQRDALVAYLVVHPDPAEDQHWRDVNGLYAHFLIDTEMSACMMTSRLKRAIGSAQLFVQRCRLNLEPAVKADESADPGWRDWQWMKNYRVWEAARKVFFHPENYVKPELRADDASPLFREAISALQSDDVTAEVAENVFLTYLERLNEVARLDIAGMYLEAASEGQPEVLHVFGRTYGTTTPSYYYRRRVEGRWTAWDRIDLDIGERQILPIVWNRRLYLFWPVFTEVAVPLTGDTPQPPSKSFDIQIAWSELARGKWQPKKVTSQTVRSKITPDDALADHGKGKHTFRASIDSQGLWLWYEHDDPTGYVLTVDEYGEQQVYAGAASVSGWRFTGCEGQTEPFSRIISGIFQPAGTSVDGMAFTEIGSQPLTLPADAGAAIALSDTPGTFSLAYLHQDGLITGVRPFFYADDARTYSVRSHKVRPIWSFVQASTVDPIVVDDLCKYYFKPPIIGDPEGWSAVGPATRWGVADPVPIAQHMLATKAPIADAVAFTGGDLAPADKLIVAKGDKQVLKVGDYIDDMRLFAPDGYVPWFKTVRRYVFETFFHPYVCPFIEELNRSGVDGLLRRDTQLEVRKTFKNRYDPQPLVDPAYPVEDVDFSYSGGYAVYNWELFFFLPWLIADRLYENHRFEESQRWIQFIFDATDVSAAPSPSKFWRTRPFFEQTKPEVLAQRIDQILKMLAGGAPPDDLERQVTQWRRNLFKPHAIAALRITAYQKAVVQRCVDICIARGDQLLRRETLESIDEATQWYILAAEILGPRASVIPPRAEPQVRTFNSLDVTLETLSNQLVDIEYLFGSSRPDAVVADPNAPPIPLPRMLYFCVPLNEKLLAYWDTVADRLFKIRHCMTIEGVVRQLPLFEPPIDPALLVRAAAAGVDISTALSDAAAPLPNYRFRPLADKATELIAEVRNLGGALLAALEKRDAERLALLRAGHERRLLEAIEEVRERQHDEAVQQLATLRKAREEAVARYLHYQRRLGVPQPRVPAEGEQIQETPSPPAAAVTDSDGVKMIGHEITQMAKLHEAHEKNQTASDWEFRASLSYYVPELEIAVEPWGSGSAINFGGKHIAPALEAVANRYRTDAAGSTYDGTRAGQLASLVLRENDQVLQSNLAAKDIMHIDQQIVGAQIREQVTQHELDNHRKQIDQAREVDEFLTSKYTNAELYNWMIGRLSEVCFQGYRLAYDVCRRAERAYRFELGLTDSAFIQFGYWDSLRKGLLAGEALWQDLKRMEASYLDLHKREHELTKHVSLALLHPEALVTLRRTGSCFVQLPEAIFDLDHPGHYTRRFKALSLTMPCTTGPYTNVTCRVTLLANRVRKDTRVTPTYRWTGPDDQRFAYDSGGVQSIVTSTGRDDAGLFQLDLNDPRYLPFEGAGVICGLRLELPAEFRQFDYDTITDVILHVRYTARDGGQALRTAAATELSQALKEMEVEEGETGLFRMFAARSEFSDSWQRFLHPLGTADHTLSLTLDPSRFPAHVRDKALKIRAMTVFVQLAGGVAYDPADPLVLTVRGPGGNPVVDVALDADVGGLPAGQAVFAAPGVALSGTNPWQVVAKETPDSVGEDVTIEGTQVRRLKAGEVADLGIICSYTF